MQTAARVAENIRYRIVAAWAEQLSRLAEVTGRILGAQVQHHYTFGWAYGGSTVSTSSDSGGKVEWVIGHDATVLTLETAVSAPPTGTAAVPLRRTFANVAAALEASTMEQQLDSTAPGGTAQKFRWGNLETRTEPLPRPEHYGDDPQGAFPIYHFTDGANLSILTSSGWDTCQIGEEFACLEPLLAQAIQSYLDRGYEVVSVGDAFLGPGMRCGATYDSGVSGPRCKTNVARGGAFIAWKPDYSGIAFISFADERSSKGGATGPTGPEELRALKTPTAADLLKEQESVNWAHNVDPKTGNLTYAPGALISAGGAEFPYALSFQRSFTSGDRGLTDPLWTNNWDMKLTISGSGNEMLGASRGLFAAPTIATLVVLEGIYGAAGATPLDRIRQETIGAPTAAWWSDRLTHNVVSASFGGETHQFVRKLETQEFWPASGGTARVMQSGTRYLDRPPPRSASSSPSPFPNYLTTAYWRLDNVSFSLTNPGQDVISYAFWRGHYTDPWEKPYPPDGSTGPKEGFRATNWTFPYGVAISLTYAFDACPSGWTGPCTLPRLASVSNALGRTLTFTGSVSKATSVTNDAGQSVTLTDGQVTHTDGKVTQYAISTEGTAAAPHLAFLDSVTGPGESAPNHRFTYDATFRAVAYTNARGQAWTYQAAGGRRASVTDPSGNADVTYFDERGLAVRAIGKSGDVSESRYDGLGRVLETRLRHSSEIPNGFHRRTTYVYDRNGNVIEERAHAGTKDWVTGESWEEFDAQAFAPVVVTRTYHPVFQSVLTETVPHKQGAANPVIAFTNVYDAQTGLPVQSRGPSGEQLDIGYNAVGLATSTTQKLNATENLVTNFGYAATGEMTSMTVDPAGLNIVTGFQYDARGNLTQYTDPRSNATTATYDAAGRMLTIRNAANGGADYVYDARGRLEQLKALKEGGGFAVGQIAYSPTGRPLSVTDPAGDTATFAYDGHDRLKYVTDPDNRMAQYVYYPDGRVHKLRKGPGTPLEQTYKETEYGPGGRVEWVKHAPDPDPGDANANKTSYGYDPYGRPTVVTFPDLSQEIYTYNASGLMLTKTTRSGAVISFAYDDSGRQISKHAPDPDPGTGPQVDDIATTYDLAGRVLTIVSENGLTLTHVHDKAGRLLSVTDQASRAVSYQYDAAGNRTRLTHADGYFVDYAYDVLNRIATVSENGALTLATAAYDLRGRITALAYGNGAGVNLGYEEDDDLASIGHAFVSGGWPLAGGGTGIEYTHTFTKAGKLKGKAANQLAMLWSPEQAQSVAYAVNTLNQYTTVTTDTVPATITHDLNGNLTGDGANAFTYDAENRLTSVAMGSGANAAYLYDPMGRRARKTVDGTVTDYLYDGTHVIAELDGSGNVLRRYVHGAGTDRPVALVEGDSVSGYNHSYYHADRLGSIVALTGDAGAPVAHYSYDAYGVPYLVDPATGARTQVAAGQPYLFTGRRFDFETGLYYYRARYYSASLGRFLQTDPIGMQDQMNLYAYVGNDPVNATDPSGMKCVAGSESGEMTCTREIMRTESRIPIKHSITLNAGGMSPSEVDQLLNETVSDGYFIQHSGENISSKGKSTSGEQADRVGVMSQLLGAAIEKRGSEAMQEAWSLVSRIEGERGDRGGANVLADNSIAIGVDQSNKELAWYLTHEVRHFEPHSRTFIILSSLAMEYLGFDHPLHQALNDFHEDEIHINDIVKKEEYWYNRLSRP